ncbi:unnamed protein product, partial [Callosobruchus maculatus]
KYLINWASISLVCGLLSHTGEQNSAAKKQRLRAEVRSVEVEAPQEVPHNFRRMLFLLFYFSCDGLSIWVWDYGIARWR